MSGWRGGISGEVDQQATAAPAHAPLDDPVGGLGARRPPVEPSRTIQEKGAAIRTVGLRGQRMSPLLLRYL